MRRPQTEYGIENRNSRTHPLGGNRKRPQTSTPDSAAPQTSHKADADEQAPCRCLVYNIRRRSQLTSTLHRDSEADSLGYPRREPPTAQEWDADGSGDELLGQMALKEYPL